MIKPNGRPPKEDRNRELTLKRLENPEKWTLKALGEFYKIHWTTAWEIFERYKTRLK